MLTYLEDNLLFILAVAVVILFALIAGGILFLCTSGARKKLMRKQPDASCA